VPRTAAATVLILWTLLSCGGSSTPQSPSPQPGTLVWQDEFDGQGLPDSSRWGNEVGLIRDSTTPTGGRRTRGSRAAAS
jgi:hypothetical protein